MEENTPIQNNAPKWKFRANRGVIKFIVLSVLTLGIYSICVFSHMSIDINWLACKHDGRHTMHYCLIFFLFSWLTFGIANFVWFSRISGRIGDEQYRRTQRCDVRKSTFWLWCVLGSFIVIGPIIYLYKLFKGMNAIAADYNAKGE